MDWRTVLSIAGIILFVIVMMRGCGGTSWLLCHYVTPKGWREWSGAGLVQAFIIALYAEMYGFPVTIYAHNRVRVEDSLASSEVDISGPRSSASGM